MINGSVLEENQRRFVVGSRQFMGINEREKDHEVDHSTLEGRSHNRASGSPPNEIVESMEYSKTSISASGLLINKGSSDINDDHNQDQDQGQREQALPGRTWVPNKVSRRFNTDASTSTCRDNNNNNNNSVDHEYPQASETMSMIRKARVSVRTRSEASMVRNYKYN